MPLKTSSLVSKLIDCVESLLSRLRNACTREGVQSLKVKSRDPFTIG